MTEHEKKITSAVEKVMPAVASIAIAKEVQDTTKDLPLEFFRLPHYQEFLEHEIEHAPKDDKGRIKVGGGSGFFVSPEGLMLTNRHVVAEAHASYTVTVGEKKYEAMVVARDPINDVAILKVKPDGGKMQCIALAETKHLKLGQSVIAVGNALGEFQNTVSTGVVSGLSRFISAQSDVMGRQERLRGLVQTDAAINPGNSGGPLINLDGEAIGINVAVVFGAQNIGFAIPINVVKEALDNFNKTGGFSRPYLGVSYIIVTRRMALANEIPQGAYVESVVEGGAAQKAGVKEDDIITKIDGEKINEDNTLAKAIANNKVGQQIKLTVWRDEKEVDLTATLGETPEE